MSDRPILLGPPPAIPIRPALPWIALWAIGLFVAALWLDTRHNEFPYFYHPDEPAKVGQLETGSWNYHHPMLMLIATKFALGACGIPLHEQNIVEAGRWVSATFAAAAIVLLSMLALIWRGWMAAFAAGTALLLHHQLFELAHYLKEDTALVFGIALVFLVSFRFARTSSGYSACLLGVAAAFAISGKYIGVVMLVVVLPLLWQAPGEGRGRRFVLFALATTATLCLLNLPLILHPTAFFRSFHREVQLVVHGQREGGGRVLHSLYLNIFRDNSTPAMWVLLIAFLSARWRERRALSLLEWLLIGFPFAFTLMLSLSSKTNDRYFLPATALFTVFAAIGALDAGRLLSRWLPERFTACTLIITLVAWQVPGLVRYVAAFQHDDNRALLDWVRSSLPATASIAKDGRVLLPEESHPSDVVRMGAIPQKVIGSKFAADLGTVDELRRRGITHAAISESDYGRYLLPGVQPRSDELAEFRRRRAFYEELLRDGTLLFEKDRDTVLYLHPGIRVYALPPPTKLVGSG